MASVRIVLMLSRSMSCGMRVLRGGTSVSSVEGGARMVANARHARVRGGTALRPAGAPARPGGTRGRPAAGLDFASVHDCKSPSPRNLVAAAPRAGGIPGVAVRQPELAADGDPVSARQGRHPLRRVVHALAVVGGAGAAGGGGRGAL